MDRTAVSGTAGTGSIPVGGAKPHPLATYSALRLCVSPLEGVWFGATRGNWRMDEQQMLEESPFSYDYNDCGL